MNKQRKVLITITYNEMGIIIDTKAEEVSQPDLQPTCNNLATDTISRKGEWIPCSERLPDKPGSYICTCSDGTPYPKVTVIKFHPRTKTWELNGTRAYWKVRAWMPLPECYKGVNHDDNCPMFVRGEQE